MVALRGLESGAETHSVRSLADQSVCTCNYMPLKVEDSCLLSFTSPDSPKPNFFGMPNSAAFLQGTMIKVHDQSPTLRYSDQGCTV
jgi:hypothetical protein